MDFDGKNGKDSYAVEVSGWDARESFFVENTDLTWTAEGIKEIRLRRPVREGSIVFVRLIQPASHSDTHPVACRVVKAVEHAGAGHTEIQLTQLRPRAFFKEAVRALGSSSAKVA